MDLNRVYDHLDKEKQGSITLESFLKFYEKYFYEKPFYREDNIEIRKRYFGKECN